MIREVLADAHRLDDLLRTRLGRPYHALLGIGLVVEIAKELRDFSESGGSAKGIVRTALAVLLFAVLLIHQLAELHEDAKRRVEG